MTRRTGVVLLTLLMTTPVVVAVPASPALAGSYSHRGVVPTRPDDATVGFTDGEVRSVAQVGDRVVVGGTFTQAGPGVRGAMGPVDLGAGAFDSGFPDVDGAVYAVAPDGAGGWFIGGQFDSVGGVARVNAAQVDGTGAVTAWQADTNGAVRAITLGTSSVYVGGQFTTVGGSTAQRVARVDRGSGALTWGAQLNNTVYALATSADESLLYVGGDFTKVDGLTVKRLAALDTATGTRNTGFAPGEVNLGVRALELYGSNLWVAGDFTKVGGVSRKRLVSVDATTGALGSFVADPNGDVYDIALDSTGSTVYLVGRFSTVSGVSRKWVAAVDTATSAATSLNLTGFTGGDVNALALDEAAGAFYIGGSFVVDPEKTQPATLARVDIASNTATRVVDPVANPKSLSRAPITGTAIWALALTGATLAVAGDFSDYGIVPRAGLAAYDVATGALDLTFDPVPDGEVWAVRGSTDDDAVFVGGEFATIDGIARNNLARIDLATGDVDPGFVADTDSWVKDLAVKPDGSALYVGGSFASVNGTARQRLAAVDPADGAVLSGFQLDLTEPTTETSEGGVRAFAVSPDGTTLMVIGNFRKIAGLERPHVAQIDISTDPPTVTAWQTDLYDRPCSSGRVGRMRDIDISPDGQVAFVVTAGHFYYPACDSVNAFPMTPTGGNVAPLWNKRIGDTLEAVAASEDALYIGGHFRYLEAETTSDDRFQLAALDPATGEGLDWEPNADGFRGVVALELAPSGLLLGSDGDTVGDVPRGRFAHWSPPAAGLFLRKTPHPSVIASAGETVDYELVVENTFSDRSVTLSSLTDSRLGDLSGQGDCTLPQVVPAEGSYTCTVSEFLSGADQEEVQKTASVSGTDEFAGAVSDSDTSTVEFKNAPPVLRTRLIGGPVSVDFPGGDVQYAVSVMNLDMRRSLNLTALSADLLGDLDGLGDCAVPQVVPPNGTYWCDFTVPIEGAIGQKVAMKVTASGDHDGTPAPPSTASATVSIMPPADGADILYVVKSPAALGSAEVSIRDYLDDDYNVILADDDTVVATDADDKAFVLISSSISPSKLGSDFRDVPTPVIVAKGAFYDEMEMTGTGSANQGSYTTQTVTITDVLHPLAAFETGTITFLNAAKALRWGAPGAEGDVVAELTVDKPGIFAYEPGALLVDGNPAAACRIAWPVENSAVAKMTTDTWTMFGRAASYAASNCGLGIIYTYAGNGTSTYAGDGSYSTATGIARPWGVTLDPDGNLVVTDRESHAVRRVDAETGVITTIAGTGVSGYGGDGGPATAALLNQPYRSYYDSAGNLYIADNENHRVRRVDAVSGIITTVAGTGTAGFSGDDGLATSARLRNPTDLAFDSAGNLFIADRANHRIRRVDAVTGIITTVAGTGGAGFNGDEIAAVSAQLQGPHGVAVDGDGNVYIADYNNERVRMVDTSGVIHTVAGTGIAGSGGDGGPATSADLHKPVHVFLDPEGGLWISEVNNTRVRHVFPDGTIETFTGNTVLGFAGDGGPATYGVLNRPSATVMDADGNLFIADRDNRRVRLVLHSG